MLKISTKCSKINAWRRFQIMTINKDYREEFSKNLKRLLEENNKNQIDLVNDLGLTKSTVSSWVNGARLPRMDKIDMLADYFGVGRTALIGYIGESMSSPSMVAESKVGYYLDNETAEIAQELKDRPELKMLFSTSRKATKEDIEMTIDILNHLVNK